MQQAKPQKPTVQRVARGQFKQNDEAKDKQVTQPQQHESQTLDNDKEPWQKASGKGLQANHPSPQQYALVTTNGFSPLRVEPQVQAGLMLLKDKGGCRRGSPSIHLIMKIATWNVRGFNKVGDEGVLTGE